MNRTIYISNDILNLVEYLKSDNRALYVNWQDLETQRGYNMDYKRLWRKQCMEMALE